MRACVRTGVHRKRVDPSAKSFCFFAKVKFGAAIRGSRTRPATALTLDQTVDSRNVRDKMEIDKRTRWWRPGDSGASVAYLGMVLRVLEHPP